MQNIPSYFLKVNYGKPLPNGGVCYYDADYIMEKAGLVPVEFPNEGVGFVLKVRQLIYFVKSFYKIRRHAYFVFQFPLYHRFGQGLIGWLVKYKKVRPVCFVVDIDGIRDGDKTLLQKEITVLKQFSFFIAPNERMKRWLLSIVPHAKITIIEFFDFLTDPIDVVQEKSLTIVFAGNLAKSAFVNQLDQLYNCSNTCFHIYGPVQNVNIPVHPNIQYKGIVGPYELPRQLKASFGLIWDGDCIDTCCGSNGEYLQYYSPHKLSLYIISGLPIIAPENSAAGDLVKKYNLGLCVASLHDLETKITGLSERDYQQMVTNARLLAARISQGSCLQTAMNALLV